MFVVKVILKFDDYFDYESGTDTVYNLEQEEEEEVYMDEIFLEFFVEFRLEFFFYLFVIQGCRNVEEFFCFNRIEEGTYGVVYRVKDKKIGRINCLYLICDCSVYLLINLIYFCFLSFNVLLV